MKSVHAEVGEQIIDKQRAKTLFKQICCDDAFAFDVSFNKLLVMETNIESAIKRLKTDHGLDLHKYVADMAAFNERATAAWADITAMCSLWRQPSVGETKSAIAAAAIDTLSRKCPGKVHPALAGLLDQAQKGRGNFYPTPDK